MKPEKQKLARDLFLNTDKTQQEIADILEVHRRTIHLWIKKYRWDDMKAAARQAPTFILQEIYNHITAVNDTIRMRHEDDRCPTMEEIEKLRKLINITGSIQKRSTGAYIEAFQELVFFMSRRDMDLTQKLVDHTDEYIRGTLGDKIFMASRERDANIVDVQANLAKEKIRQELEEKEGQNSASVETPAAPNENQNPATASVETSPSAAKIDDQNMAQECNNNVTFCDKDQPADSEIKHDEKTPEPLPIEANSDINPDTKKEKDHIPDNAEDVTFSFLHNDTEELTFDQLMQLPLGVRPSPFIDGNTIWVTRMDDLEDRFNNYGQLWGTLKMGHEIRFYPDINSANAA